MTIVQVKNVSKCFHLQPDRPRSFQELVVGLFKPSVRHSRDELLWALNRVSFQVEEGETLGIIGSNGSGKSTCLKLLTRILEPTSGTVTVDGRVSALLELGAGFHPELTGRENIYLHGSVIGLSRQEMTARFDEIVGFAELERFVDVPVKFYSSGMYVRLAFATAIKVDPDILIVDEVLAVGDQRFQAKCLDYFEGLKASGVSIIFVSHDLGSIAALCDRVIWLDQGVVAEDGPAERVVHHYIASLDGDQHHVGGVVEAVTPRPGEAEPVQADVEEVEPEIDAALAGLPEPIAAIRDHWGSQEARVTAVTYLNADGESVPTLTTGQPATVCLHYVADQPIEAPVFGVGFHRHDGLYVSGTNTLLSSAPIERIEGSGEVCYEIASLPLLEGSYYVSAAIHSADESKYYDYQRAMFPLDVRLGEAAIHEGVVHVRARWSHQASSRAAGGVA